jgi:hypothetical protein
VAKGAPLAPRGGETEGLEGGGGMENSVLLTGRCNFVTFGCKISTAQAGAAMDDLTQQHDLLSKYSFLKDTNLSDDLKKFLVEKSIETGNAVWTRQMEEKKWRWSTPLAIALTGAITIGVNFFFDYWRATQAQSNQEKTGDADARRKASAEERQFEYKLVERELGQEKTEADRAKVLLFLVRAGVLNSLNVVELKSMADAALKDKNQDIGIPSLGNLPRQLDETFRAVSRRAARLSVGSRPAERFNDLSTLIASLPSDSAMASHVPKITEDESSPRVVEEQRNVRVKAFLYAASREASNDYHLEIGDAPNTQSGMFLTARISGLPPPDSSDFLKLKAARESWKEFFGSHLPGSSYDFYDPPIPIEIEGSLFFNISVLGRTIGPPSLRTDNKTVWEITPITKIVFE